MAGYLKAAALGLLALVSFSPAHSQIPKGDGSLLSQALPTQPTYGSELGRGVKASFGCPSVSAPDKELKRCYDDAIHQNIIANPWDARPFELGVYLTAFIAESVKLDSKVAIDVREHSDINGNIQFYFVEYVTLRKELGLSDAQVIAFLGMAQIVEGDLRRYETHPELLAPNWKEP